MKLSEHLATPSEAALSHSNKLDGLRLSPHFSLGELTKSKYAEVENIPSRVAIENLTRVCTWLEELRFRYNLRYVLAHVSHVSQEEEPIIINSGYRSPELNRKVGGAANSNHLTGCAVDIRCYGIEQALRYAVILMDISDESKEVFDELLIEKHGSTIWLHFAVRPPTQVNRRKIGFLKA